MFSKPILPKTQSTVRLNKLSVPAQGPEQKHTPVRPSRPLTFRKQQPLRRPPHQVLPHKKLVSPSLTLHQFRLMVPLPPISAKGVKLPAPNTRVQLPVHIPTPQTPPPPGNNAGQNGSSWQQMNHALQEDSYQQRKQSFYFLLGILMALMMMYELYKQNVQEEVIDKSVLRDEKYENKDIDIVDALSLKSASEEVTSGRSRGHKVIHAHENEDHKYYYYKYPFDREGFLKELIVGAIGRWLFRENFPRVLAVETPVNDLHDDSRYGLISESINEKYGNKNLEEWALLYARGEINYLPRHLGVSIAFDMLFGKSDSKLANLIVEHDAEGNCYSIDHESAFNLKSAFVTSPQDALNYIGEYRGKAFGEIVMEQASDGCVDTERDNFHQPLKGDHNIKAQIAPVLKQAIQNDMDNGKIRQFYEKFAAMTEQDFRNIFARFGSLIHENEQKAFLGYLQTRQEAVREFLASQPKLTQETAPEETQPKRLR